MIANYMNIESNYQLSLNEAKNVEDQD